MVEAAALLYVVSFFLIAVADLVYRTDSSITVKISCALLVAVAIVAQLAAVVVSLAIIGGP